MFLRIHFLNVCVFKEVLKSLNASIISLSLVASISSFPSLLSLHNSTIGANILVIVESTLAIAFLSKDLPVNFLAYLLSFSFGRDFILSSSSTSRTSTGTGDVLFLVFILFLRALFMKKGMLSLMLWTKLRCSW